MSNLIFRILLGAVALLLAAELLPGVHVDGIYPAVVAAIILGLLNAVVRPLLIILTLPVTILTLGLFLFVINASLFWFVASFIDKFDVDSFWYALAGSLIVSLTTTLGNRYLK